ncbi:MAG: DUF86 domain-containing protein [Chloroflexi bacterium]|nr:DUF86 domain-containing protein [Chloroflexota bacterium]
MRDILENARKAQRFVADADFDAFIADDEKLYAVMLALEIIGEAAKKVPPAVRARYSQVPWREVAGMRDKLSHAYFEIDVRRVWETVLGDVPSLQATVEQMLKDLEAERARIEQNKK